MGKWFTDVELRCRCGRPLCDAVPVDPDLVDRLDRLRDAVGKPLYVASATRCRVHNEAVGGVDGSAHVGGLAVDIVCTTSALRYKLLKEVFKLGFTRVGVDKKFVHMDISKQHPNELVWVY